MSFLYDSWYCASWSADLGTEPKGIRLLDQEVVLYRDTQGKAHALEGRCPHRFAPLSRGRVVGETIECGYHGLRFDGSGACVFNPHGRQMIPAGARLKSYIAFEKSGAVWVWMGDPSRADPADIMSFDYVTNHESWVGATGYLKVKADYRLVIDNLLDLTHATYIHKDTLGFSEEHSTGGRVDHQFKTDGTVVHSNYVMRNSPPTPVFAPFFSSDSGDIHAFMRWQPASSLILDISMTECNEPKGGGVIMPSGHFLAPESENSCHYFFFVYRNVELDNHAKTVDMVEMVRKAFVEEDEPMVQDCYTMMEGRSFFDLEPVILETDIAAVQARRILAKLTKQQNATA